MTAFVTLARRFFCVLLSCLLLGTQTYYSCAAVATLVPTPMPPADALHSSLAMPAALPAALTALDTQIAAVCIGAQSYTWPAIVITDAQADTLLRNVYTAGCTVKRIYQKSSSDTTRIAYSASYCNSLLAYGRYAYSRAQYRESSQAFLRVLEHINALPVTYCFQFDQNYAALADTGVKNAANAWAVITTGNEPKITTDEPTGTAQNSEQASTATCNGKQTSTAPPPESKAPALGCPIHSVDADTLNVFLTDMPLAYQPVKGPPVELKLVYSATRTTPSCLDRKWHCSLDSWLTIISASGWPRHEWPLSQPLSEKINGQDKLITAVQIVTPSGRLDMYTYNGCEPIGPLESNTFRVYFRSGEDDPRDAHIAHRANTLALDVRATREDYNGYIHWTFEQAVASMPD
ncbi:MAG: hypothetical protein NTV22_20510, partial [bacterium]|nr:hypothetical protein [bacterium]